MEKRLILAIILSVVILVAYQMIFVKTPPPLKTRYQLRPSWRQPPSPRRP